MGKIKIALIGFGKMGQEVNNLYKESEIFEVVSVSFKNKSDKLDIEGIKASNKKRLTKRR